MAPTAELTETPVKTSVFQARRSALTLIQEPERLRYADGTGQKIIVKGKRIHFEHGRYETADPEEIEWLREHSLFGNSESGFFEMKVAAPEPIEEMSLIAEASMRADVQAIRGILTAELEGFERPMVVQACERALGAAQRIVAENEAKVAAQPVPPEMAPPSEG